MKRIVHVCWGLEPTNGAANIARLIAGEQTADGDSVELKSRLSRGDIQAADEVWCHCGWYYGIWWTVFWAKRLGKCVRWVPEGCYDPVRLAYHGWKKRLVGPIERWALRQCDEVIATCPAEAEWIRAYEPRVRKVSVTDIRRFYDIRAEKMKPHPPADRPRRLLYLGRAHPLKGTAYLQQAVVELGAGVELKMASAAQGGEKAALWAWADALVLPTLSDNFGLVVAEALERGVPAIVTDGAPAWRDLAPPFGLSVAGYRDGTPEVRVRLLKAAISRCPRCARDCRSV